MTQVNDPTSQGGQIVSGGGSISDYRDKYPVKSSGVYIGVEAGSQLEQQGYEVQKNAPGMIPYPYFKRKKPKYKVGYQNSKQFAREMNNMDPNVIYLYQQRLNASGLLDTYNPGQLDKSTRAAFKELLATANQTATTWQSSLQDLEAAGGRVETSTARQPFVAQLDDPATLRATFQQVAQQIYGGDLPDAEINSMVDAYRNQQLAKQQAAYDVAEVGGTVDSEANPSAFAQEQLKATHPDQLARVKFSDTLGTILKTFSSGTP